MSIRYGTFVEDENGKHYAPTTPFDAIERVRSGLADGLTIDCIERGNVCVSYEVRPGCIEYWHDEECH